MWADDPGISHHQTMVQVQRLADHVDARKSYLGGQDVAVVVGTRCLEGALEDGVGGGAGSAPGGACWGGISGLEVR